MKRKEKHLKSNRVVKIWEKMQNMWKNMVMKSDEIWGHKNDEICDENEGAMMKFIVEMMKCVMKIA